MHECGGDARREGAGDDSRDEDEEGVGDESRDGNGDRECASRVHAEIGSGMCRALTTLSSPLSWADMAPSETDSSLSVSHTMSIAKSSKGPLCCSSDMRRKASIAEIKRLSISFGEVIENIAQRYARR